MLPKVLFNFPQLILLFGFSIVTYIDTVQMHHIISGKCSICVLLCSVLMSDHNMTSVGDAGMSDESP